MITIAPNPDEAKAFMQIIYSSCMADRRLEKTEETLMAAMGRDLFSLPTTDRIDLNKQQMAEAVGKIKDGLMKYYLVAFVLEMGHLTRINHKPEVLQWVKNLIRLCDFPGETALKIQNVAKGYNIDFKHIFGQPRDNDFAEKKTASLDEPVA